LSVDSIVNPGKEDWVLQGTIRKPYKRYKVENIVNESLIHQYEYWKSGVLKSRTKQIYPFEQKRNFLYGKENEWLGYTDSTFSEGMFVTKAEHEVIYDEYKRPVAIHHYKYLNDEMSYFYRETLHYRSKHLIKSNESNF
jgi:hypothetical protein